MSILLFLSQREDLLEIFIQESKVYFGEPLSIASYRYADSEAVCFYLGSQDFGCKSLDSELYQQTKRELANLRLKFSSQRVDILFVEHFLDSKKPSLFVFDMDSTLIREEVIDELARRNGKYEEVANVTKQAMEGGLSFNEALQLRVRHLKGLPTQVFSDLYNNLNLNWGVAELLNDLKAESQAKIAVLSGGFTPILELFSKDHKIDYFEANHLVVENSILTGEIHSGIVNKERKKEALLELKDKYNILSEQIVAVGDGANDSEMLLTAKFGIGFHAKQGLKDKLLNWIDYQSMEALMLLFGPSL
jgi:phosphoserine phosphatase